MGSPRHLSSFVMKVSLVFISWIISPCSMLTLLSYWVVHCPHSTLWPELFLHGLFSSSSRFLLQSHRQGYCIIHLQQSHKPISFYLCISFQFSSCQLHCTFSGLGNYSSKIVFLHILCRNISNIEYYISQLVVIYNYAIMDTGLPPSILLAIESSWMSCGSNLFWTWWRSYYFMIFFLLVLMR